MKAENLRVGAQIKLKNGRVLTVVDMSQGLITLRDTATNNFEFECPIKDIDKYLVDLHDVWAINLNR